MHLFLTIDNRNANSGSRPQFPSRLGLTQIKWEHVSDSTMPAMPRYDWTHFTDPCSRVGADGRAICILLFAM